METQVIVRNLIEFGCQLQTRLLVISSVFSLTVRRAITRKIVVRTTPSRPNLFSKPSASYRQRNCLAANPCLCLSFPTPCYICNSRLTYFFFVSFKGYPVINKLVSEVKGRVVPVIWKLCSASLFTIYHREVLSEGKSHWKAVNVSGHEISYDLYLTCGREYEIAVTAWNSTGETPLTALNHRRLWRVKTLGGNNSHSQLKKMITQRTTNLLMKYLSIV